jgi:hypothetical protein
MDEAHMGLYGVSPDFVQLRIYYQEIILFLTSKHSIMYEEVSFMQNSELLFTKKLTILLLLLWLYREVLLILENNTECLDLTPPFQDRDLQEISRGPPFSNSATNCMNIMYGIMLTVLRTPHFWTCCSFYLVFFDVHLRPKPCIINECVPNIMTMNY